MFFLVLGGTFLWKNFHFKGLKIIQCWTSGTGFFTTFFPLLDILGLHLNFLSSIFWGTTMNFSGFFNPFCSPKLWGFGHAFFLHTFGLKRGFAFSQRDKGVSGGLNPALFLSPGISTRRRNFLRRV